MPSHVSEPILPKVPEPYWRDSTTLTSFPSLQEGIDVDVAVVGAGITGIIAAYLLSKAGVKVALLEADKILNGTTGHTTAKITAQHGLFYDELIQHMGETKAKQYYESNLGAIEFIRSTSEDLNIDCQFQNQDAYVYSVSDEYARAIDKEYKAYQTLGINGELADGVPFNVQTLSAIVMKGQAQFHPLWFLASLLDEMKKNGTQIFEGTTAVDVDQNNGPIVVTREGHRVRADKVLSCSHYPFYDGLGFYFTRMYAERAYILAGKIQTEYPGGMYISAEKPTRSLRSVEIHGEPMVLLSGEGHRTGQGNDTMSHYKALRSFGQDVVGMNEIKYRWSAQDLFTLDKVPYIGELTQAHPNVLVATGYKKWGMTSGTVAALLLSDLVLGKDNPYVELYSPARFYADPSLKRFLSSNLNVAAHLIKGKFEAPPRSAEELEQGEGSVVTYDGVRAGAYKDVEGQLYVVDTTCTHLRCEVNWNHGDRTWDCPCHGSRFSYTGEVIEGPAEQPLRRLL